VVKIFFASDTEEKDFNTEGTEKDRKGASYGGHPIRLDYKAPMASRIHCIELFGGALHVPAAFRAATGPDERACGNGRSSD
jgi:hypothetical protein